MHVIMPDKVMAISAKNDVKRYRHSICEMVLPQSTVITCRAFILSVRGFALRFFP